MHCSERRTKRMVLFMTHSILSDSRTSSFRIKLLVLLFLLGASCSLVAEPDAGAVAAFNAYIGAVESRLAQQHRSQTGFLVSQPQSAIRLRQGESLVEQITPPVNLPDAMLHHWRGTVFAPGAKAADCERLLKDFNAYPRLYAPQVLQARVLTQQGDRLQATMRVRQWHVLTVVMDTTYDVLFGRLDARHGYSLSRSIQVSEIDAAGTRAERVLGSKEEHGFLWRLNTYWSYEERDGGLYMQIESISLTRSIPTGLGWAIRPFVESVPRESLEFTLRSSCNALRK